MSVLIFKTVTSSLKRNIPSIAFNRVLLHLSHPRLISAMEAEPKEVETDLVPNKKFTRYNKRQWYFERNDSEAKKSCDSDSDKPKERIKRKKMAMMLGYCGVNYFGMQRNPGVPTIEEELLKALYDAKYISEDEFKNQQNMQFQRSSRTDKGVSAARQVVSLKLPLTVEIEEINKRLPECIKVFGIRRVTNKFNSKIKCNARSYSYTLPTYVFDASLESLEARKKYRISAEKMEMVKKVLQVYQGTKNYHNFTLKKYFNDPSANRYMMFFNVEKVFIEGEMEFAVLIVKGQSFMLHQIRKMVGLMIAIVRDSTNFPIMEKVFNKEKLMTPIAPGLGLVLETVHYERYAAKFKDSHDSLTWEEYEGDVQKFKHKHIYPVIVKGEIEDNNMGLWLSEKLARHSYEPVEDDLLVKDEKVEGVDSDDECECDEEVNGKEVSEVVSDKIEVSEVVNDKVKTSEVVNNEVEVSEVDSKDDNGKNEIDIIDVKV